MTNPPSGNVCGADASGTYGIVEKDNGQGGCPPKMINYSMVNAEATAASVVPFDVHCNHGTHLGPRNG